MLYRVEVCEVRKGFIEVEADSVAEAEIAACIEFDSEVNSDFYSLDAVFVEPIK